MDVTFFFAKLFAIYFIVAGISVLAKPEPVRHMARHLADHPFMLYLMGFFVLILGSILVLVHNVWDGSWRVLITIISWLTLLKGISFLLLPQKSMVKMIRMFSGRSWINVGGFVIIIVGLYLGYQGFLS